MEQLYDYRACLLDRIESIVPELADAVAAIPEGRWHQPLTTGGRSPHAVVVHLRDVEREAYLARVRRLLSEESPELAAFDPLAWEAEHYNRGEPMTAVLADYAGLREAELQLLRPLPPPDWTRAGRHLTFGARTVLWWVERIAEHSIEHLRELRGLT